MSAYIFSSHHIHRNPTMQPIVRWHVTEVSIRKISARRERWRIKKRRAKCRRGDLAGDFSANFDCTSANRSALGIGHWAERSYCETGTWATVTRAAGRSSRRRGQFDLAANCIFASLLTLPGWRWTRTGAALRAPATRRASPDKFIVGRRDADSRRATRCWTMRQRKSSFTWLDLCEVWVTLLRLG